MIWWLVAHTPTHTQNTNTHNHQPTDTPPSINTPTPTSHLALLCIGELGAQRDLSASVPGLQERILESFQDGPGVNEETKTAAAYALGE